MGNKLYLVDELNRLIVKERGKRTVLEGNWELTPGNELMLNIIEDKNQDGSNTLILKGKIIAVDGNSAAFEVKSVDKNGQSHFQILKLSGIWQADEFNRLTFLVNKKGEPDTLVLEGAWQINNNQQITHTFEKVDLKRRSISLNTLTFDGFWCITDRDRISYIFSKGSKSRFDFKAQVESSDLHPKQGVIKYRLGIGLREGNKDRQKIVSLYGAWKFSRDLGLEFLMDYGQGRIKAIEFSNEVNLSRKDRITLSLTNREKEPLGMNLIFTHRFLKKLDAEAYLKLKANYKGSGIEAGVKIPF
ncbi:MAG: hypothetical protein KKA59_04830 [Candidatus Omnitrophica bacterium]|nr:hypothetical protein [Candidatus Omnitrophota bacterium]